MKTELTKDDLDMLQDALAFKLLYLKGRGPTSELTRLDTLPIMRLAAKLEAMKEGKDDRIRSRRDRMPGAD